MYGSYESYKEAAMGRQYAFALGLMLMASLFGVLPAFGQTCDNAMTRMYIDCRMDLDGPFPPDTAQSLPYQDAITFCENSPFEDDIIACAEDNYSDCGEIGACIDDVLSYTPCNFSSDFVYTLCDPNSVKDPAVKKSLTKEKFRGYCDYYYVEGSDSTDPTIAYVQCAVQCSFDYNLQNENTTECTDQKTCIDKCYEDALANGAGDDDETDDDATDDDDTGDDDDTSNPAENNKIEDLSGGSSCGCSMY